MDISTEIWLKKLKEDLDELELLNGDWVLHVGIRELAHSSVRKPQKRRFSAPKMCASLSRPNQHATIKKIERTQDQHKLPHRISYKNILQLLELAWLILRGNPVRLLSHRAGLDEQEKIINGGKTGSL